MQGQVPTDTILVVTPSPGTVRSVGAALLSAGYEIEVVQESDVQSMTSLPEGPCLALIVTADTPILNSQASEVCSVLKLRKPTLPLIALGPDVLAFKLRLFALGIDDYVVDSLDRTELLVRIKSLIRKRRFSSTNPAGR